MKDIFSGFDDTINLNPESRPFKARSWLNKFDTDGAKAIRKAFVDLQFAPPEFDTSKEPEPGKESFLIYMGLGFTGEAVHAVNHHCSSFLQIFTGALEEDVLDTLKAARNKWPGNGSKIDLSGIYGDAIAISSDAINLGNLCTSSATTA